VHGLSVLGVVGVKVGVAAMFLVDAAAFGVVLVDVLVGRARVELFLLADAALQIRRT